MMVECKISYVFFLIFGWYIVSCIEKGMGMILDEEVF